ncbi:hypothetical protein FACS189472_17230 [Alphaproteobacteria bacterium]|nr:hypothetical protein FACS189472_17230 [Alphaproteobacteria bacterium]
MKRDTGVFLDGAYVMLCVFMCVCVRVACVCVCIYNVVYGKWREGM